MPWKQPDLKNNSEIRKLTITLYLKFWDSKSNGQNTKFIGTLMFEIDVISDIEKLCYHIQV